MDRSTAFFINGGAGRVISSIPAFEIYAKENPNDDFIIVCEGGMDFYKGHPVLHNKAYDFWHKGLFEEHIKHRNCVTPEPYRVWEYYNQQCSIAQAFDIAISNKGLRDIPSPKIYHNKQEIVQAFNVLKEVKSQTKLDKVLVLQPFGRGVENHSDFVIDGSSRSFTLNDTIKIINELKKDYTVVLMSEFPITLEENLHQPVAMPQISDLRLWSAIIEIADHFLGCDSVGQHIAKSVGTTATVVLGSTFPINTSFVNDKDVDIFDLGEGKRVYSPIRLTMEEEQDRLNDEVMEMSEEQRKEIIDCVKKRLGKSTKFTEEYIPVTQSQVCPTHGVVHGQEQQTAQPAQLLGHTGKPKISMGGNN